MATELMIAMAVKRDHEIGKPGIQPSPVDSRAILGETEEEPDPVMLGCGSRWFRRNRPDGWEQLLDILGLPAGGPLTPWPDDLDAPEAAVCVAQARKDQERVEKELKDAQKAAREAARPAPKPRPRPASRPNLEWIRDAACRAQDLVLFFGRDGERQAEKDYREQVAKQQFCSRCPVRFPCLEHALTHPEKSGTWGGLSEDERASERRRRQRRATTAAVHVEEPTVTSKHCPRCETTRDADDFGRDVRSRDGLNSMCRDCTNDAARQRRAAEKAQVA